MTGHTATRPYLIRAIHEWAVDNNLTPHVLVDTTVVGVKAPAGYARGGRITFNIHPQAVMDLSLGNEWLLFSARFGGNSFAVEIPEKAVLAIYARETGRGIFFQGEDGETADGPSLARGPRLDPIGETADGPTITTGRTSEGGKTAPAFSALPPSMTGASRASDSASGPRLDPIGETAAGGPLSATDGDEPPPDKPPSQKKARLKIVK